MHVPLFGTCECVGMWGNNAIKFIQWVETANRGRFSMSGAKCGTLLLHHPVLLSFSLSIEAHVDSTWLGVLHVRTA